MSSLNLSWHNSRPLPLVLLLVMREKRLTLLTTTTFQGVVEGKKISPEPPLLQTKQSQFPQLLLIRSELQPPHHLHCYSLDTLQLQGFDVFLVVRGPKLNTLLEVWHHQG